MPSPHPNAAAALPSSHNSATNNAAPNARPAPMKRHSSQQSHGSSKHGIVSPSSAGDHHQQPLRHHVKPARKTKIVLPRNNSSARNLAKMARGAGEQHAEQPRGKHGRQRSHEGGGGGEEGPRLPGSLGEDKPPMRRNLTSSNLPRNQSHSKLKKNLSHGQLARIGSGRNLQELGGGGGGKGLAPPSPGLKGKVRSKKKSLDSGYPEKDLHEQEMEIAREQERAKQGPAPPRRVGFAVGDGNESSDEEGVDDLQMEGSGLQEDEWTDQSASASPATTRQNTANNSRRGSVSAGVGGGSGSGGGERSKLGEGVNAKDMVRTENQEEPVQVQPQVQKETEQSVVQQTAPEGNASSSASDDEESDDEGDPPSPRSMPQRNNGKALQPAPTKDSSHSPSEPRRSSPNRQPSSQKSPLNTTKDHPNPFTKQLLNRNNHTAAPALVSNVSAMDDSRSARGSPAASMRSSRSNIADGAPEEPDELVSRFIPSTSHPTTSSGGNTTMNTPKTGSYQTPENESLLAQQRPNHRERESGRPVATSHPPTSPGSTLSASSGTATPAMLRSRTELRMANERAMAEIEGSGKPQLMIPAHKFDRRNESLKSYLNVASASLGAGGAGGAWGKGAGPEMFEGRFKAVENELKAVQRFRDPWGEAVARLQRCEAGALGKTRRGGRKGEVGVGNGKMVGSKSAVGLSKQGGAAGSPGKVSPAPAVNNGMTGSKSAVNVARAGGSESRPGTGTGAGRVKFSQAPSSHPRSEGAESERTDVDSVARMLWEGAEGRASH